MISVALKFIPEKDRAPRIIASGSGLIGDKILEIAKKNEVSVYKDPPLAETLSRLPLDKEIPEELYKAVAVVFAFLYDLEKDLNS
jgi:flagellar biosynthesis protein